MGGVLILIGLFIGVFLWADLYNPYNWLLIFITFSFGILGAFDDYKKIKTKNLKKISSKFKLIIQIILGLMSLLILYNFIESDLTTNLYFPFFKNLIINLGWFFIPFYLFVIVGSSNAEFNRWFGRPCYSSGYFSCRMFCFYKLCFREYNFRRLFINTLHRGSRLQFFVEQLLGHQLDFFGLMLLLQRYLWVILDL